MGHSFGYPSFALIAEETTLGTFETGGTNEVQRITPSAHPDTGTYKLIFRGQTTGTLNWNDAASVIQAALIALNPTYYTGNIAVSGDLSSSHIDITFSGGLGSRNFAALSDTANTLTASSVAVTLAYSKPTPGVAPTLLYKEIVDEGIQLKQNRISKPTLNRTANYQNVLSKQSVEGPLKIQAQFNEIELLLKHAFGKMTSAAVGGVTGAYSHTFDLTDQLPTGLSVILDRDSNDFGSQFEYLGLQIEKLKLSQAVEDFLELEPTFMGIGTENLIIPYNSPTPHAFNGIDYAMVTTLQINGQDCPGKMTEFELDNGLSKDRYKLGSRLRIGMQRGAVRKVSGKIEVELNGEQFYDLFKGLTQFAVKAVWTGPTIAGSSPATPYSFELDLTKCAMTGTTPNVKNHDIIMQEIPFEAFLDPTGSPQELQAILVNETQNP